MGLNQIKLEIAKKHRNYLILIYKIGNGVMFKKQIEEFAEKFMNTKRTSAQEILKELRDHDIVDYIQYQRAVVVKLKKFALQYLKECDRDQVSAVNITPTKIRKSAYISALILDLFANAEKVQFEVMLNFVETNSTFYLKEREGYKLLNMCSGFYKYPKEVKMEADVFEKCSVNSKLNINSKDKNLERYIPTEEGAEIEISDRTKEYNLKNYGIKTQVMNEKSIVEQEYHCNSIIQGYTYIVKFPKQGSIQVYIFDLTDSASISVITKKIINFYNYFGSKLKDGVNLYFHICVSSSVRYQRFFEQADKFDKAFSKAEIKNTKYYIKDLNVSSLFLNRKIAMSAENVEKNMDPVPYKYSKTTSNTTNIK